MATARRRELPRHEVRVSRAPLAISKPRGRPPDWLGAWPEAIREPARDATSGTGPRSVVQDLPHGQSARRQHQVGSNGRICDRLGPALGRSLHQLV